MAMCRWVPRSASLSFARLTEETQGGDRSRRHALRLAPPGGSADELEEVEEVIVALDDRYSSAIAGLILTT